MLYPLLDLVHSGADIVCRVVGRARIVIASGLEQVCISVVSCSASADVACILEQEVLGVVRCATLRRGGGRTGHRGASRPLPEVVNGPLCLRVEGRENLSHEVRVLVGRHGPAS